MTAEITPRLKLPFIMAAQAQKHVTHNEGLRILDALVQLAVEDRHLGAPPLSPDEGSAYIVAAESSGDWESHAGHLAVFQDGAWAFHAPLIGWLAWVRDEGRLYAFDGTAWIVAGGGGASLNPASMVGINTEADDTNRLAVAAPATLFTHDGDDHRQKINKATASDTATTLYQTGYSGRAEIGLAGDDDFQFKVSPDGEAWHTALTLVGATGVPRVPAFTLSALPSAAGSGLGALICIADAEGGPVLALSDGETWVEQSGGAAVAVATPTFSPAAGSYSSAQSITLSSATSGATIHYTADGSAPDEESSVFITPIAVEESLTLKAIGLKSGLALSAVASAAFVITEDVPSSFVTWTAISSGASQVDDYLVMTGVPQGARATEAIDATSPFSVVYYHEGADNHGVCLFLDDDTASSYESDTSPGVGTEHICGLMCNWEHIYRVSGPGANQHYVGTSFSAPPGTGLVRMRKSGNDIVFEKSEDAGATWSSPLDTASGVLAGKTTVYLKAMGSGGSRHIKASIET